MVIEIPRPSTKSAIKAKDNSVKGKYTKICLTVQQKRKKGIEIFGRARVDKEEQKVVREE